MPSITTTLTELLRKIYAPILLLKGMPGFIIIVLLPMALAAWYFLSLASDRFMTEAQLTVKQSNTVEINQTGLASLISGVAPAQQDVFYLQQYIQSLDMLLDADKTLGLRRHWSDESKDWLSRLDADASQEDFLKYYRNRVSIKLDETTGIMTLRVQGYTPEFSQHFASFLIQRCETFINELSHNIARDQVSFIETELSSARKRLEASKAMMLAFQGTSNLLNPAEQAKSMAALQVELESEISKQDAELKSLQSYLNADAPQVVALRSKIEAMKTQLSQEKGKLTGKGKDQLNQLAAKYLQLEFEVEFAQRIYESNLTALEQTRIEAAKKLKNVLIIVHPQKAVEAEYPRPWYDLSVLFALLLLAYGSIRMVWETIQDHRR